MKILRDLKKIKVNEERPNDISNQTYSLRKRKKLLLLSKNFSGQALHRHLDISTQFFLT